jgi:hypothetical protein
MGAKALYPNLLIKKRNAQLINGKPGKNRNNNTTNHKRQQHLQHMGTTPKANNSYMATTTNF